MSSLPSSPPNVNGAITYAYRVTCEFATHKFKSLSKYALSHESYKRAPVATPIAGRGLECKGLQRACDNAAMNQRRYG